MPAIRCRAAVMLFLQVAAGFAGTVGAMADTGFRRQIGEGAIAFDLEVTQAPAADRTGTAVLRLTARAPVSGGTLEIVAGGFLLVDAPRSGFEPGTVRPPYFADLPVNSRLRARSGRCGPAKLASESLTLRARGPVVGISPRHRRRCHWLRSYPLGRQRHALWRLRRGAVVLEQAGLSRRRDPATAGATEPAGQRSN